MEHADGHSAAINPIAELRLRRWARENYVPEEARGHKSWHPIVLDEMRRKDRELQAEETLSLLTSTYVPLAPRDIRGLHPSHEEHFGPFWSRATRQMEASVES